MIGIGRNGLSEHDELVIAGSEVIALLLGVGSRLLHLRDRGLQLGDLIGEVGGIAALRPQDGDPEGDRKDDESKAGHERAIGGLHPPTAPGTMVLTALRALVVCCFAESLACCSCA